MEKIIASPESPRRQMLLCECVQAYAPLDDSQRRELDTLFNDPQRRTAAMAKTWSEMGEEKGRVEAYRDLILLQLETRFSPLSEPVRQRVQNWPAEKLRDLAKTLATAQSLKEVGLED